MANKEKISKITTLQRWAVSVIEKSLLEDDKFGDRYERKTGDDLTSIRANSFAALAVSGFSVGFVAGAGVTAVVFVLINVLV